MNLYQNYLWFKYNDIERDIALMKREFLSRVLSMAQMLDSGECQTSDLAGRRAVFINWDVVYNWDAPYIWGMHNLKDKCSGPDGVA